MNVFKVLFWTLIFSINISTLTYQLTAQSIPEIPLDIDFAGMTVHLNEQSRMKLQHEVEQLYSNRADLQRDIESLRQLTPLLEPLLRAERLPMDYRYAVLPFAGDDSTGYWGLTPNRALALKMVVNNAIDERYHPIPATRTVAAYLSRLHTALNNYALTLLQYLQSDTIANRSADKPDSTYLLLDAQSPALIWKIVARKLAFEREEPLLRPTQIYLLYEYRNGAGYSLQTISRQLRLDEGRFKPFNTWLKAAKIPDEKEYPVLIRVTADEFPDVKNRDDVRWKPSIVEQVDVGFPTLTKLSQSTANTYESAVFYTINDRLGVQAQPCDNVITLAHYGKIKIETLLSYNELSDQDVVQPGRIYYLERKAKRAKIPFHVVGKNQTLREIANVYGVRLQSLLQFNHLQPTQRVQSGRIVWMRKKRPRQQPVEYRQPVVVDILPAVDDTIIATPSIDSLSVLTTKSLLEDSLARRKADSSLLKSAPVQTVTDKTESSPDSTEAVTEEKDLLTDDSLDESKEALKLHVVQRGQTYYSIAQLYGVTLKQLYAWNNLSERVPLKVGQELIVDLTKKRPVVRPKPKVVARPKAPPKSAVVVTAPGIEPTERVIYHIVRAGQTVYRVALINKVSIPDLMRWNNLKDYTIEVGQRLLIRKRK